MTIKERLIALVGFQPANDNAIEGELVDAGLIGSDVYGASQAVTVKTAAIKLMELLLTTADTKNENGYSIVFDRKAVQDRIDQLKGELGLVDDSLPVVNGRSCW